MEDELRIIQFEPFMILKMHTYRYILGFLTISRSAQCMIIYKF